MTDFLPNAHISAAEISKVIKRLKSPKRVGLDGIPSLIIKGSDIFIPLLTYIVSKTF
jgi:hypothetical protein